MAWGNKFRIHQQLFLLPLKVPRMVPKRIGFHRKISVIVIVSVIISLLTIIQVSAAPFDDDDYPIEAYANPYNPYGWGNASPHLVNVFPTLTIEPLNNPGPSSTANSKPLSSKVSVTISPFSAAISGQKTNLLVGYISGTRTGVTLTIAGKGSSDSDFSDITPISPDENGLFVWNVPTSQGTIDLFRVSARSAGMEVLSNAIRFTDENKAPVADPVISPVKSTSPIISPVISPVQTPIPTITSEPSGFSLSRISIRASTTTPAVGEEVAITGRLTDQNGVGISGATVTMDESGYSGADPLTTTQTSSDGSFEFTVGVSYAYTVGMLAHYDGDESHSSADSNTIMFTAH